MRVGDRDGEAENLNNLGELALDHPAAGDPYTYFDRALTIAREIGTAPREADALHGMARCLLHGNRGANGADTIRARDLLTQARATYDRIGSPQVNRIDTLLAELATPD